MLVKIRNDGTDVSSSLAGNNLATEKTPFCLISQTWLFTTEAKQRILKEHIKCDKALNTNLWQMTNLWSATMMRRPLLLKNVLMVRRENLLGQTMMKLKELQAGNGDVFKLPINV